ncbi:alpha/beta fold hydrolase [Hymenobacter sediminicola]|uniref:Alpha/beta hydrolase n=1 Tax=Hymenobacter sediminicola TaxID=2761579 RepID=A0A7G7W3G5_9BACT|nr:alpha/beta hydrolase [Hymenobacter sediminicola]QNH60908.1 alpha/beta hydrolase [Hymenobacter sediminicola]
MSILTFLPRLIPAVGLGVVLAACRSEHSYQQLPPSEQMITVRDEVKVAVKVAGQGYPCLYVHGGPGQDYLSFEQLGGNRLEQCLTMIYMDQRGSGHSQNAANYHLDRLVEDIEEVRQQLGAQKIYLLSHSFGGILAVNYARKYPQRVAGLILANSTLHFFNNAFFKDQTTAGYRLLGVDTVLTTTSRPRLVHAWNEVRQQLSQRRLTYRLLADSISTIARMDSVEGSYSRTPDFGTQVIRPLLDSTLVNPYPEYVADYTALTAQIHVPTLVITGTRDYAVGVQHYKSFQFPQQQTVVLPGSHLLYYENNTAFVRTVCSFVSSVN